MKLQKIPVNPAAVILGLSILWLVPSIVFGQVTVYDLADDWSDTNNPNGPWSYNAGDTPISNHLDAIFTHVWSEAQPGWAMAPEGAGHTPAWFKLRIPSEYDIPIGTVAVHGSDPDPSNPDSFTQEPANVTWTSPAAGTISISGGAWLTQALGRSMNWTLTLNGVVLDSGLLNDADPYDSTNPDRFSVSGLQVAVGDVIKWETAQAAEPYPHLVAIDLTITATTAVTVYDLADDWSDTNNPNGPWSYNAGDTPISSHLDAIATHVWSEAQPGWAMAPEGAGHTPVWFKLQIPSEYDIPIGTVAVHGSDPDPSNLDSFTQEPTNVTWTSPAAGTISISGGAWLTQALGRSMNWTLTLNGVVLDSGLLNDADPYDSTNPDRFSVSGLQVAVGDVVKWETAQAAEPYPHLVAIDLTITATTAVTVYDLADDWSDTNNPNGPWSYNAGDAPIASHLDAIFTHAWNEAQPGWAMSPQGADHVPAWFKMAITDEDSDLPVGTVAVHGSDPDPRNTTSFTQEPTNVTWTSPLSGTISVSGGAWLTQALGRSMNWTLTLNDVVLDSGLLNDADPYDSSNPDRFSVSELQVIAGDVVKWETAQAAEPFPHVVAIDMTITAQGSSGLELGLVAHYPLDANAFDTSGNGLDGTLFGALPTENRDGRAGKAYLFDGLHDYIEVPYSARMQPAVVTLALWAQRDSWAPESFGDDAALAGNTDSGGYEFYIDRSAGELQAYVRSKAGDYAQPSIPLDNLTPGWHHFALTCDGVNTILYVDGEPIASDATGDGMVHYTRANSFIIGEEASAGTVPEGDNFAGRIDDVRVYERVLRPEEIRILAEVSGPTLETLRITRIARDLATLAITLEWELPVDTGVIERSTNLTNWETLATNVTGTDWTGSLPDNPVEVYLRVIGARIGQ